MDSVYNLGVIASPPIYAVNSGQMSLAEETAQAALYLGYIANCSFLYDVNASKFIAPLEKFNNDIKDPVIKSLIAKALSIFQGGGQPAMNAYATWYSAQNGNVATTILNWLTATPAPYTWNNTTDPTTVILVAEFMTSLQALSDPSVNPIVEKFFGQGANGGEFNCAQLFAQYADLYVHSKYYNQSLFADTDGFNWSFRAGKGEDDKGGGPYFTQFFTDYSQGQNIPPNDHELLGLEAYLIPLLPGASGEETLFSKAAPQALNEGIGESSLANTPVDLFRDVSSLSSHHKQSVFSANAHHSVGNGHPSFGSQRGSYNQPLPNPNFPPSGAPSPYNFPQQETTQDRKGALDYLSKLLDYLHDHPSDPVALQDLMQFIADISKRYHGAIPPDIAALLDDGQSGGAGAMNAILSAVIEGIEYAFFAGYGQYGNGAAGVENYIDNMLAALRKLPSNKYIQQMINAFNGQKAMIQMFIDNHTAQADDPAHGIKKGDLIWKWQYGPDPDDTVTYDWTNPNGHLDPADGKDPYNDQYYISEMINNSGDGGIPNPYRQGMDKEIDQIQRDYRMLALKQLLAAYKDPIIAITLWIMGAYDDHFQSQQSGLNETTDILTMMTNSIASRLSQLAQNIGQNAHGSPKMTPQQAQDFFNTLLNGTMLMGTQFQLSGLSDEWRENVFSAIENITVTVENGKAITIGDVMHMKPEDMAKYLCMLNPTTPDIHEPGNPTPNQGYQQIVSILQQAGSYITGTSKTVSMQLQTSTGVSSQLIKTWATLLQDLGQWIIKIVGNYKTQ